MTSLLRRMFSNPTATAVVVRPAERDHGLESVIRENRQRTAEALIDAGRSSSEIRKRLAGNVLNIVSGDR